ncbi:DUF309 domain-containing protein [Maioricimonas sp. JC845]|uniref:DUF309 domain-containing protein n=1 Tax=Maioricimonas sp. JC845 TaxID=3232138 RepID=UPI003458CB7F
MYNVTMNPPLPDTTPFFPDWPLPPYTYIPGHGPHPIRDPAGHSHGIAPEPAVPLTPDNWPHSRHYLRGFDLFNAGCYWEAHEIWESCWIACGRTGTTADFLKGLIKLAAAGVKVREQNTTGSHRHVRRARELFNSVRSSSVRSSGQESGSSDEAFLGVSFAHLDLAAMALEICTDVPAPSDPPRPLLTFALQPARP